MLFDNKNLGQGFHDIQIAKIFHKTSEREERLGGSDG